MFLLYSYYILGVPCFEVEGLRLWEFGGQRQVDSAFFFYFRTPHPKSNSPLGRDQGVGVQGLESKALSCLLRVQESPYPALPKCMCSYKL